MSSVGGQIFAPQRGRKIGTRGRTTNGCDRHLPQFRWFDAVLNVHQRILVQFIVLIVVNVV
jgi:hypothetical protein